MAIARAPQCATSVADASQRRSSAPRRPATIDELFGK
jgi:hypothetical protein